MPLAQDLGSLQCLGNREPAMLGLSNLQGPYFEVPTLALSGVLRTSVPGSSGKQVIYLRRKVSSVSDSSILVITNTACLVEDTYNLKEEKGK